MKKGFTLIELLAVIVILAIIALIATPIILGIINDAREESNERSVELYVSAVRNAIAANQLTGTTAPESFSDLTIQYDGDVECTTEELYSDGSFYIANCTVNGTAVDYTYGTQKIIPPTRYYSRNRGSIDTGLPSDAKTTVPEIDPSYPFYLGFDVDSIDKIIAAYVCFVRKGTEYCVKGADTNAYTTNVDIIREAYSDVVDTEACTFESDYSNCSADDWSSSVSQDGNILVNAYEPGCYIFPNGSFGCDGFY